MNVSPEQISAIAGAVISVVLLLLPIFPKYADWWNKLTDAQKQSVNVIAMVVVAVGIGGLSCAGVIALVSCTVDGLFELVKALLYAIMGNAATFVTLNKAMKVFANRTRSLYHK